ncbi:hypothetical protein MASR2M39_04670 [Ignavibacteriales bacterium]
MDCDSFYTDVFSLDGITGLVSAFGSATDTTELPDGYTLPTSETVLVTGPGIYQDRTYKVVHRFDDHVIPYTANFRMRMGKKPIVLDSIPVCSLRVKIVYPKVYNNTVIGWDTTILAEKTIYSSTLENNTFRNIEMDYEIKNLGKYLDMDINYPYEGLDTAIAFNSSKVYYEVVIPVGVNPRQYGQLFIDNIIVMDDEIWNEHGSPVRIAELLNSYNNIWPVNDELNLYNEKIKFFYTMDEPHSYDHFLPYRMVEDVQKTLNRLKVYIKADNNNIPTAQLLASQNTTNAITTTDQYHAQTEELTIALRGTTLNRNIKNDVGSITTMNKSGMNNLMKRHGNKFTIKKEPKPEEVITEYSLSQNYPNPFNSSTIIEYTLPKDGLVSIKLYDITGRLVKQLVNEQKPTGRHKTTIESGNFASGVYIYSLRSK